MKKEAFYLIMHLAKKEIKHNKLYMEIFNIHLGEADAKEFCKQSESFKIDWIKKNTNQKDETLIKEFLSRPAKHSDCGCGCGGKKTEVVIEKVITEKKTSKTKID